MQIDKWEQVVPPREWKKIRSKIDRLKSLSRQIDRGYARRRFKNIEKKEVEAERLEEELAALHDIYSDASDAPWTVGEGYSLEELLIMTYMSPERFADRSAWLNNMKENVRLMVQPYQTDLPISDEQVLEIAEESFHERQALIQRYKKQD
jgi:hypothetical protein